MKAHRSTLRRVSFWLGVVAVFAGGVRSPLAWAAPPAAAEAPAPGTAAAPVIEAISASLRPFVERQELAGAVALVAVDGQIIHLDALGLADVESGRPMTTETLFSIMSMTKPVAAVAALILCDEGRLALDEPVAKHLSEFAAPPYDEITLRHLLTHTSGLFSDQVNRGTLAETVAKLGKVKLNFTPGTRWLYSPGLTVAGRLVEVVSGQPFHEFVAARICGPLGMQDTTFYPTPEQLARLASVYAHDAKEKKLARAPLDFLGKLETRSPNPSAGLYSTARDLLRFYQMLLGGGELDGTRILSAETVAEMTRPQTGELRAGFVPGSAWGLGVGLVSEPQGVTATLSPGTFGHGGMLATQSWADPQRGAVYILLVQRLGVLNSDASDFRGAFQEAAGAAVAGR